MPEIFAGTFTLVLSCFVPPRMVYTAYTAGSSPSRYCSGSSSDTSTSFAVRPSASSSFVPGSATVTVPSVLPPPATGSCAVTLLPDSSV